MSSDLDRATKAAWNHEWSEGYDRNGSHSAGEYREYVGSLRFHMGHGDGRKEDMWRAEEIVGAALLSFLDMDEAGVERIARVLIPEGWDDSLLPHATPSDHPAIKVWRASALRQARAVLTELRKMASPTQRDEGE